MRKFGPKYESLDPVVLVGSATVPPATKLFCINVNDGIVLVIRRNGPMGPGEFFAPLVEVVSIDHVVGAARHPAKADQRYGLSLPIERTAFRFSGLESRKVVSRET